MELNCVDDQGRTPAHYAATAGGLDSLKVLAHNDIDINSRDTAGCVPAHYAAAHNYCSCLVFLLSSGLAKMDVRDRSGRSLLHMVRMFNILFAPPVLTLSTPGSPVSRDNLSPSSIAVHTLQS